MLVNFFRQGNVAFTRPVLRRRDTLPLTDVTNLHQEKISFSLFKIYFFCFCVAYLMMKSLFEKLFVTSSSVQQFLYLDVETNFHILFL